MKKIALVTMVTTAFASLALAQDSVSSQGGLPGDGLDPYSTTEQCADYVVDMTAFKGSKGSSFMIAPVLKSSKENPGAFFGSLISASTISRTIIDAPAASTSYAEWFTAGAGVSPFNDTPSIIPAPEGDTKQFALSLAEFSRNYNGILGAVINIDPANDPNRLYVKRVTVATNSFSPGEERSQFGNGGINAQGDITFRADNGGSGVAGPNGLIDDSIFHINLLDRECNVPNVVDNSGQNDPAGNTLILNEIGFENTHLVPNITPADVTTGWKYIGVNFRTEYRYGDSAPISTDGSYLSGSDTRGSLAYMTQSGSCFGGAGGTAGILAKSITSAGTTDQIDVFGIELDGSVTPGSQFGLKLPATMVDNCDPNVIFTDEGFSGIPGLVGGFNGYRSQAAFRGGVSQVALQKDPFADDRLIAAATVYPDSDSSNQTESLNFIAAARVTCEEEFRDVEWGVVAYAAQVESDGRVIADSGKEIYNADGVVIGRLIELRIVTNNNPFGPSLSQPAIDAAGNIWFIAAVNLTAFNDGTPRPEADLDTALIRAIYDPVNFCYTLELVLELGNTFTGKNSDTDYRITFMPVAGNSALSSQTVFSTAVSEQGYLGNSPSPLLPASASNWLGGFVVGVGYAYDIDGDGEFVNPSGENGDPNSIDEFYNGLLYVAADPDFTCGDVDCDGVITASDISPFVNALLNPTLYASRFPDCERATADINGDGSVDASDISPFVRTFLGTGGCTW